MGALLSKKVKETEKDPINKDIKNGITKEAEAENETDFIHGKANNLTGNLNNTANTSQGLGPTQIINHQMEPSNGSEAMPTRMDQVPAFDVPENRAQSPCMAVNTSQDAEPVNYVPHLISAVKLTQQHAAAPTEPHVCSTLMSNWPKAQVNNKENALHQYCFNSVPNTSVEYHNSFVVKLERSRANAAKMKLRKKQTKKLKALPGDGSKNAQQTAGEIVTTEPEGSQQQGCTAQEENPVKQHNEPHLSSQPKKAYSVNVSSCIQKVNMKVVAQEVPVEERRPTNNFPIHKQTTTAADTNVKLRLQGELKVSLPQAVKPEKKCSTEASNQHQSKDNTANVILKEEMNGKNGQVEKEKQEPAFNPQVTPEDKVFTEGRWPRFTINQSCSHRAHCKHNPGKGLPPNVLKWFDDSRTRSLLSTKRDARRGRKFQE